VEKLADVRKRMGSVKGIGEVCRTLATVASAKLARTHERARGARLYAARLRELLARQQAATRAAGRDPATLSVLMGVRPDVTRICLLVVGADRGLCGGYNITIGREARAFAMEKAAEGVAVSAVVKGRRAETYLRRATKVPIEQVSGWTRAGVTSGEVDSLLNIVTEEFLSEDVDEVWACYTAFISTMRREPSVVRLLPVMPPESALHSEELAARSPEGWFYEPAQQPCVEELLAAFVRLQVEDVLLEAYASEQAARMVTMQEASERADRALAELRVHYNRLRRESITADLVGVLVAGRMRKEAEAT
jgi:F-type H+-transporting ATPase subunit gamma